jgi:hypothetical protein
LKSLNEAFDSPKKAQKLSDQEGKNPFGQNPNLKKGKFTNEVNPFNKKQGENPFTLKAKKSATLDQEKVKELSKNLTDMGFNADLASKAVLAAKKLTLPDVLEKAAALQEEEKKKNPGKVPTKIKAFACPTCTFMNKEGSTSCEMCSSPAPASAIIS